MYYVYAIGKKEHLSGDYSKCYVGVTNRPKNRWKEHTKSGYYVGCVIRKYSLSYEENFKIIYSGSSEECFIKENQMRPHPQIGLNIASGGCGGDTGKSRDPERIRKISMAMKKRKVPWIHKVVENRRSYDGAGNPKAALWKITDPEGREYFVEGSFQKFCDEHQILSTTLRKHLGKPVPPIPEKTYGGYRPKSEESHMKRINSIGWVCEKQTKGGDLL